MSIMLRVDAASKSLFEKRSTDTHVSHVANPFSGSINSCGIKDYKGVSRVLCALGLYWPGFTVIGKYFETACACHNVKQSVTKMTQLLKRVTI